MELNPKWSWVETDSDKFSAALDAILNTEDNLFILGLGGVDLFRFSKLLFIERKIYMGYKEKWIKELGEDEGLKKWNKFKEMASKRTAGSRKERWIKELGEEEGLKKYAKFKEELIKRQSGSRKEKWIKELGEEEGLKKWNEFSVMLSEQRSGDGNNMAGKSVYEVWIKKYGKEEADKRLEEFKTKMSEVTSGEKNPMYGTKSPMPRGISTYEFWLKRYGKEEADRRKKEYSKKLSASRTGEKNPMYGRSPANTTGAGISGRYKGWFFRSLLELSYMVGVIEKKNLAWEKGEQKKFTVKYTDLEGTKRTTKPDFYLVNENRIIEIKPKYILKFDKTIHKLEEARKAYVSQGYDYEIVTPEQLSLIEIKKLYEDGHIVFSSNKRERIENILSKIKIKEEA